VADDPEHTPQPMGFTCSPSGGICDGMGRCCPP
jgi:hypothetical protein